jgi:hypothetical protein
LGAKWIFGDRDRMSPLDFSSPTLHPTERVSAPFTRGAAVLEIDARGERKSKGAVD